MAQPKTYSTAGAFRKALEERLKRTSQTDQIDLNRLRRHVSFDRLLARLFHVETPPWVLKGGYALELRYKTARSTVDIDLTLQRIPNAASGDSVTRIVREMLQRAADILSVIGSNTRLDHPSWISMRRRTVAPAIRSKLRWTRGSLRASIWTRASAMLSCSR